MIEGFAQWIITIAGVITALGIILKWFRPKLKQWLGLTLPEDVLASLKAQLDTVIENQNVINENVLAVQNKPEEAELSPEVAAAWETILSQMQQVANDDD
jgi:hypothetical protein